eukprot:Selendium_serpulae@DN1300_c0_g1_i1.p1
MSSPASFLSAISHCLAQWLKNRDDPPLALVTQNGTFLYIRLFPHQQSSYDSITFLRSPQSVSQQALLVPTSHVAAEVAFRELSQTNRQSRTNPPCPPSSLNVLQQEKSTRALSHTPVLAR